jgi:F-type H+-transporting ATPase subunit delta
MAAGDTRVARRYANALFRVARERNELDSAAESIASIYDVANSSPEFMAVLHHPRVTRERKRELLRQIFENRVPLLVEQFLFLLIEKDRAVLILDVAKHFARLMDEYRRETDAEAVTAVALTEPQIEALKLRLQETTGYTVRLKTRVDASIMGGMIVRVGDRMIDGSVTTQLQAMREQLMRVRLDV